MLDFVKFDMMMLVCQ